MILKWIATLSEMWILVQMLVIGEKQLLFVLLMSFPIFTFNSLDWLWKNGFSQKFQYTLLEITRIIVIE
jgi:hypothetical protein